MEQLIFLNKRAILRIRRTKRKKKEKTNFGKEKDYPKINISASRNFSALDTILQLK